MVFVRVAEGVGVGRHRAGLERAPREMSGRVAPDDLGLVPVRLEHLHRCPRRVEHRFRAEVADALVNVDLPIRSYDEQTVHPRRTGGERAQRHPNPRDFGSLTVTALGPHRLPIERIGSFVDRLPGKSARHVRPLALPRRTKLRLPHGRVHPDHLERVEIELLSRLVHHRGDHRDGLESPRRALRGPGRCVRVDREAAQTLVQGLIHQRGHVGRLSIVARPSVWSAILHQKHVDSGDTPVASEPDLDPALEPRPRPPDEVLLQSGDPHHHRSARLP